MNTIEALYGRSEAGLMVPRAALQPAPQGPPAQVKMTRQVCRWLERHGVNNHCPGVNGQPCGKVISMNAHQCAVCANEVKMLADRVTAAGLVLP